MATDQRTGSYAPHKGTSRIVFYSTDEVEVKCLICAKVWRHPRNSPSAPSECVVPVPPEKSEGEIEHERKVKHIRDGRYRP